MDFAAILCQCCCMYIHLNTYHTLLVNFVHSILEKIVTVLVKFNEVHHKTNEYGWSLSQFCNTKPTNLLYKTYKSYKTSQILFTKPTMLIKPSQILLTKPTNPHKTYKTYTIYVKPDDQATALDSPWSGWKMWRGWKISVHRMPQPVAPRIANLTAMLCSKSYKAS